MSKDNQNLARIAVLEGWRRDVMDALERLQKSIAYNNPTASNITAALERTIRDLQDAEEKAPTRCEWHCAGTNKRCKLQRGHDNWAVGTHEY